MTVHLPNYTYQGLLGTPGNFGEVYLAVNDLSGASVAIKHINGPFTPATVAAWMAEAQAMQACDHPNLTKIHHAELTPDGPALVMEFLPEGSVASRYGTDPAPVGRVVSIAVDACWGLHRLHQEGITHRDLKPGNLLLAGETVKLGDFGLARSTGDATDIAYSLHKPPEIRLGDPWTVECDIYALGATAWRLLWGDTNCGRLDPDVESKAFAGDWPDRDAWPPHVHKRLRTCLRAALHPDPAKRPSSAAEFRNSLEQSIPAVSWLQVGPDTWLGTATRAEWRVSIKQRPSAFEVTTTRDLGSGHRRSSALCAEAPTLTGARQEAKRVLEALASGD